MSFPIVYGCDYFGENPDQGCDQWYSIYPGCMTCDGTGWLSCFEGLFLTEDTQHCVETCSNVNIDASDDDQSPYFADSFARICRRWGPDCENCKDDIGWVSCLADQTGTDATSVINVIENDKQQWMKWSDMYSGCNLCTSSECTSCSGAQLVSGACTTACDDSHCRSWNSDHATCEHWEDGYVLTGGDWVQQSCTVSNCNDCTSNSAECDVCLESYFQSSSTTCDTWVDNCLECSDGSTCDICASGYILSSNGSTWVSSWGSGEYIEVKNLSTLVGDLVTSKQCKLWDSTCKECIKGNSSDNWVKCPLGKYLGITNSTSLEGTCTDQAPYENSNDIFIYVSNLNADYTKDSSLHLGTLSAPDISLMKAIRRAKSIAAKYSTKQDGSDIVIHIVLFKGDHYMLRENVEPFIDYIDFYGASYQLKITPYYCSLSSTPNTTIWYNETNSDSVNIWNKLGPEFTFDIPKYLLIENIVFEMIDGLIKPGDDIDDWLTTRKKWCYYDEDESYWLPVDDTQDETWEERFSLTDFCHRSPKYNMLNFHPYHSEYGLTSPPEVVFNQITIQDVYYDMNSLVDYNTGGHVTITSSSFLRFSNCGSIVKNTNPSFENAFPLDSDYTGYYNDFILRKNTLTTDYDCTGETQCTKLTITDSTFYAWSYNKFISSAGLFTNPNNGYLDRPFIVGLEDFNGDIYLAGNYIEDVSTVQSSCGIDWFGSFFSPEEALEIYGDESTKIQTHMYYIENHERNVFIGDTFSWVSTEASIIYINQGNMYPDATVVLHGNSISNSGTYLVEGMIRVQILVDSIFETTDTEELTDLLTNNELAPCSGFVFSSNYIDSSLSCSSIASQLMFYCITSTGAYYQESGLSNSEIAAISNTVVNNYTYSYNSVNYTVNRNYFNMKSNHINQLLGSPKYPIIVIDGFFKVNTYGNVYTNNGQYLSSKQTTWTPLLWYKQQSFDLAIGFCQPSTQTPTTGFMDIINANEIVMSSDSVTNHFFIYATSSLASTFGAYVTFKSNKGTVIINNLSIKNQTGTYGDYNRLTLAVNATLTSYKTGIVPYQFVPSIMTDKSNYITSMKINTASFNNSVGYLSGSSYAGLFINLQHDTATNYIDVLNLEIDNFSSYNCYIYGTGALIYKYGNMSISNSYVYKYGYTVPLANATVSTNAAIMSRLRPDHYFKADTVKVESSLSTTKGPSIFILSDTTVSVTAIEENFLLNLVTVLTSGGTTSAIRFNIPSLTGSVTNLNMTSNTNTTSGAIYLTGGGTISFDNAKMINNYGTTWADVNMNTCTNWVVVFNNSVFTRDAVTTTGTVSYTKQESIYATTGGSLYIYNSQFSNYLLVEQGSVINAESSINIEIVNSTFTHNSAANGGVIFGKTSVNAYFESWTFTNNSAGTQGGVLFARFNSIISTVDCTFSNNSAPIDAILTALQSSQYNDVGSTFMYNIATTKQAFGSIIQGLGSTLDSSKFIENSVTGTQGILLFNLFNDITLKNIEVLDNSYAGGIKNFYLIASSVTIENSNFTVTTPTEVDPNDTSRGGFSYLFGWDATFTNNTFINGRAQYGAALYLFGTSYVSDSCTFIGNEASLSGGAYYALVLSSFTSFNDTMINNKAEEGDCFGLRNINSYVNIQNGTFLADFPAQFIWSKYTSLNIEYNAFEQTDGFDQTSDVNDGSAIYIDSSVRLNAKGNTFTNIMSNNGAIAIVENSAGVSVGDLYSNDPDQVLLQDNLFDSWISYGTFGGAAVYYDCSIEGCQLYFDNNTFENGFSYTKGGAVSWTNLLPTGLEDSTFVNNTAIDYGDNIAAIPQKLKTVSQEFYDANIDVDGDVDFENVDPYPDLRITDQNSGSELPVIYLGIFDQYDNLVKTDVGSTLVSSVTVNSSQSYAAFLTETKTISSINGLFKIEGISITWTPGTNQTVTFTTSSIDETITSNSDYLDQNNLTTSGVIFTIEVRLCEAGEAFKDNGAWVSCTAGQDYLLVAPTTVTACTPCPLTYAQWLGGDMIVPKPGYWRASTQTDTILQWYTTSACEGYTEENEDLLGGWSTGYQGVLCADCVPGYSRTGDFECGKCPNHILNIIRITGFMLLMVLILIILVRFTIQGANNKRNILGVYNRVLVNHVQMVVIIYSFRLNWLNDFNSFYSKNQPAGEVVQQFISFDWFLDKRSDTNLDANPMSLYYYRVIIMAGLPIFIFIITYLIWTTIECFYMYKNTPEREMNPAKYKKRLQEQKGRRLIATNLIVLMFIHPNILEVFFEMFNCQDINGTLRLDQDFNEKCYTGLHSYISLLVALPAVVIWGIGIPAYAFVRIISKRKELNRVEVREEIGYLYSGYADHGYYWEPVIMTRKLLMVFLSTIQSLTGKRIQAMMGFAVMIIWIIAQNAVLPFMSSRLNALESLSIVALMISMYCGLFLVTDKNNNLTAKESGNEFTLTSGEKSILFTLFIAANLIFFIYWLILFMIEAKRFFRIKFQKFYHRICLCGNKQAIKKEQEQRRLFMRADEMMDNFVDLRHLILKTQQIVKDGEHSNVVEYLIYMRQQLKAMKKEENSIKQIVH